jgi:hypothetical protein
MTRNAHVQFMAFIDRTSVINARESPEDEYIIYITIELT